MSMRDCIVIAIEGTHACGKTTLVHALMAHYRAQGVNVACTGEPARSSRSPRKPSSTNGATSIYRSRSICSAPS